MPLRYWLFVVLTILLTTSVGAVTYRTAVLLRHWRPDYNLLLVPGENVVRLLIILICVGLGWLSGLDPAMLGWQLSDWPRMLLLGLIWGGAMAVVFVLATRWLLAYGGSRFYSPVVLEAVMPRNPTEMLGVAIAMVGVVLLEEILFRSLLIGGLLPILPASILLLVGGLLFGGMHMPQGLWGVAGAAIAGVALGLLFLISGSVLAPITAHYVANMVQITQAIRQRSNQASQASHDSPTGAAGTDS